MEYMFESAVQWGFSWHQCRPPLATPEEVFLYSAWKASGQWAAVVLEAPRGSF